MTAFPNLHALAYGEGGQRLSAELRVEAADALERLNRHCDECAYFAKRTDWSAPSGWCHSPAVTTEWGLQVAPNHACNLHQSLTPAHDEEKP